MTDSETTKLEKQVKLLSLLKVTCHHVSTFEVYAGILCEHCHYLVTSKHPISSTQHWVEQLINTGYSWLRRCSNEPLVSSVNDDPNERCMEGLHTILSHPAVKTQDVLVAHLIRVSCVLTCHLLSQSLVSPGCLSEFINSLKSLCPPDNNLVPEESADQVWRKLPGDVRAHVPCSLIEESHLSSWQPVRYDLHSLVVFLHGLTYLAAGCTDEGEACRVWSGVTDDSLSHCVLFLKGCLAWRRQDYSGALLFLNKLSLSALPCQLHPRALNLAARCHSAMGRAQTAMGLYRQCVSAEPHYLWPVFNLSVEFAKLGQKDAQIATLTLLVQTLAESGSEPRSTDPFIDCACDLYGLQTKGPTYTQALYTLASTLYQHNRYSESSSYYLDLIIHLRENHRTHPTNTDLPVPSITDIFLETIQSLMKNHQYEEALTICDVLLNNQTLVPNVDLKPRPTQTVTSPTKSSQFLHLSLAPNKKSQSSQDTSGEVSQKRVRCELAEGKVYYKTILYKAECLCKKNEREKALEYLNSLLDQVGEPGFTETTSVHEGMPRKRHMSETGEASVAVSDELCSLLASVYSLCAMILYDLHRPSQALRASRLSLQNAPHDETVLYNHSLMLVRLERPLDGAATWLPNRGLHTNMDPMQFSTVIKRKEKQLGDDKSVMTFVGPSESTTENHLLHLDLTLLRHLENHKLCQKHQHF